MRLSALEPEARSGGVRVHVDGRPFGTVGAADVTALGLERDGSLSEKTLADLAQRAEAFSARVVALRMLAARALSATEVQRRLLRKGHSKASADLAVQGLLEAGLINDDEFARHYARTRARRQRFGPRRLVADLKRMGVKDQVALTAVTEALAEDGLDAGDMLREAAARKVRSLQGIDTDTARRRLRAYLLRRGFSGREVIAVVKDALPR